MSFVLRCCIPGLATALPPPPRDPGKSPSFVLCFFNRRWFLNASAALSSPLGATMPKREKPCSPLGRSLPLLRSQASRHRSQEAPDLLTLSWSIFRLWRVPRGPAKLQLVLRGLQGVGSRQKQPHQRNPAEGRHKMFPTSDRKPIHTLPCSQEIKLIFHFSAYVQLN